MSANSMKASLKQIAKELENNGKNYSVDNQAALKVLARAIVATVDSNKINKNYSYDEDD